MKAFADAIASGSLRNLRTLDLGQNLIGDDGISAFARAIAREPLANLELLRLNNNMFTNAGFSDLTGAVSNGFLPFLRTVVVFGNPGNEIPLKRACQTRLKA